ncbi:MAG: hypothetical protein KDE48_13200 [Anaerolineales bacterium]|nr:hypothetical protein [Anaerolineales bacterium]
MLEIGGGFECLHSGGVRVTQVLCGEWRARSGDRLWIPACAGMTFGGWGCGFLPALLRGQALRGNDGWMGVGLGDKWGNGRYNSLSKRSKKVPQRLEHAWDSNPADGSGQTIQP